MSRKHEKIILIGLVALGALEQETAKAEPSHVAIRAMPRSGEKWWVQRQERIERRLRKGEVDAIFIGDSITEAWEHYHGRAVWEAFYGRRQVVNLGFGGDQTQHVLWRLDHSSLARLSPKVAVIMIGTNNISAGHSVQQIVEGILAIVERLHQKLPTARILMHGVLCRGRKADGHGRQETVAINLALAKLAAERDFEMCDLAESFLNPDGTAKAELMGRDFLHLSAKGYQAWAEAIEGKLTGILGDQPVRIPPLCPEEKAAATAITALGGCALVDRAGHITTVDLGRNQKVDGDVLRTVGALRHLKVLACDGCPLGDDDLRHIAGLSELEYLNLSGTRLSDAGLRHLRELKNLQWLAIGTPHIAGPGLTHVEHLSNLRLLTFWNSALTDAAYQHLREMKSLWELFLGRTQVTPETIEKLKRDLPNCALVL